MERTNLNEAIERFEVNGVPYQIRVERGIVGYGAEQRRVYKPVLEVERIVPGTFGFERRVRIVLHTARAWQESEEQALTYGRLMLDQYIAGLPVMLM